MGNLRSHGSPPYRVAVLHGGPGAAGEMVPVARRLSARWGVLEPLQTATSLEGQVQELRLLLEAYAELPVTLIGYSWGAWLGFILAARSPDLVAKLILISSGPFEQKYVSMLMETRLSRLDRAERGEFEEILEALSRPETDGQDALLARLEALTPKTDRYDPLPDTAGEAERIEVSGELFQKVWQEAAEMRRSGDLLRLGARLTCPVVAIHGDYDPHPAAGVREPLGRVLGDFRFILLENCGHTPWKERGAQEVFYQALAKELG